MTTPAEHYPDLAADDDPALARLVARLDQALHAQPAPPQVRIALERALHQRIGAAQPQALARTASRAAGMVSRRAALKAGAAGMAFLLTLGNMTPAIASELAHLAQERPMTGARLAGILRTNRIEWSALLGEVGRDRMEESGAEGEWSVKELIAHLTWYESRIIEGAQQILGTGTFVRGGSGLAGLPLDERNELIAAEARTRPVEDVLAEANQVFGQLLAIMEASPDDLLNDPQLLGLPDDIPPWMRVANNSYAHYREHAAGLRAWLERTKRAKA